MSDPHPSGDPRSDPNAAVPPSSGKAAIGLHAPRDGVTIPRAFGRYRILSCIGRGGMGAVFRAHDTQLDRPVALKVPFLNGEDPYARERFVREARAAAALHHANICPVYDVGELHGLPYLTMALIEGRSLSAELESGRPFNPNHAARLVRKLALAMQEAHARGVVHRDLKPANVLLRPDGEPVVMDFGLARRDEDRRGEGMTRQGDVIGTIEYMSPEQFEGDNAAVGPASDVYSLGVVLYELLTGRRPFAGSAAGKVAAILLKPPPRPSELRPGLPARLEEICLKAMAKKPAERYATMAELAAALTAYLRSPQPDSAPPADRSTAAPPTPRPGDTRPVREKPAPPKAGNADPGWEVVEDAPAPPPPTPRPVVRAKLVKPRKKAKAGTSRPVLFGGVALAAACLSVILAAVIMRTGGQPSDNRPVPSTPPPSQPAEHAPPAVKPPPEFKSPGESHRGRPGQPKR